MSRKILFLCTLLCACAATPGTIDRCAAALQALDDTAMARISGSGGISIGIGDLSIYMHTGSFSYTDTDTGNSLVLENLVLTNGAGRPAQFATGNVDTDGDGLCTPLTFDVGTIDDPLNPGATRPFVDLAAMDWQQQVHLHAGALRFCGQELGSLDLGVIERPSFYWLLGGHSDGIDFEHGTRFSIETVRLTYNPAESFALNGIHLAGSATGAPEDPSSWQMTGLFRIGHMAAGSPATFDVGGDGSGSPAVQLSLPMAGSLRMENLQWGGVDFGPIAIDGLQVHRLTVRFNP